MTQKSGAWWPFRDTLSVMRWVNLIAQKVMTKKKGKEEKIEWETRAGFILQPRFFVVG